jgi:hypothetical protein
MIRYLILAVVVAVAVVGSSEVQSQDSEIRAYIDWLKVERELSNPLSGVVDTLAMSFTLYHHKERGTVPHSTVMMFVDMLMDDAERMQQRITRLAVDSAFNHNRPYYRSSAIEKFDSLIVLANVRLANCPCDTGKGTTNSEGGGE